MTFKRLSTVLIALTMTACITSCGDNDEEKSSSKSSAVEAQTVELSTVETSKSTPPLGVGESSTEPDWQKIKDDYQNSVLDKERKHDGFYLIDYITVNFKGYEHDSDVEVIVDWDKLAADLGNGITPDFLEQVYHISVLNTKENSLDHAKVDDLINGEEVNVHLSESTLQSTFKQKYSKELKYLDENVWGDNDNPAIVTGLKTKVFLENAADVDKKAINDFFEITMNTIKESTKEYSGTMLNKGSSVDIDFVLGRNSKITDETKKCRINDYKVEKTYLATRTAASYNDSAASGLPDNMVFNIYKLTVERYGSGEIFEMYYRTEVGNVLYENEKMVFSDEEVEVQFAGTTDELMPDSKFWEIQEVK